MRTITALPNARIPLGRQGENEAARVVWPGIAEKYRTLYGEGIFALGVQRSDETEAHPAALTREGDNLVWVVTAEDTAAAGIGRAELQYLVGETVAKSQTWTTEVYRALAPIAPSGEPGAAWYAAVQAQIGNLDALTTRAKDNLVAAINEAAKSGGGGGTAAEVEMRVEDGCIQYTSDGGETWESLIALEELKGKDGKDGEPGKDGAAGSPGADGYSPSAKVEQTATGATITITDRDGTTTASVTNGKDGAPGAKGDKGDKGDTGEDYTLTEDDKSEIAALAAALVPSSGGGDLRWIQVASITTEEETNTISISTDADGREISGYHALGMIATYRIPADSTQSSTSGSVWVYPSADSLNTAYRAITSVDRWQTVTRVATFAWFGLPGTLITIGASITGTASGADIEDIPLFSGTRLYIHNNDDHFPVGTKVNVAVLSKGWSE